MGTLSRLVIIALLCLPETCAFIEPGMLQYWNTDDPAAFFQSVLWSLAIIGLALKALDVYLSFEAADADGTQASIVKPLSIIRLERKYLSVFWLMRTVRLRGGFIWSFSNDNRSAQPFDFAKAFWMSGPYFYSACASKTFNGEKISVATISQLALTGYVATPIFGPIGNHFLKEKGPKVGSIIAVVLYAVGALSLCSSSYPIVFVGRAFGGIGTSMMSSAPEAWLVSEARAKDKDSAGMWLPGVFGKAFQIDSILAILAGRLAGVFADQRGPTGPFQASPFILGAAVVLILLFWHSSTVGTAEKPSSKRSQSQQNKETLLGLFRGTVMKDTNILLTGSIQVFFEASMNVFVMLWPPTMDAAVKSAYGESSTTPYGAIFSCMMASCVVGGLLFGELSRLVGFEFMLLSVLSCAMLSMGMASYLVANHDSSSVANHDSSSSGNDHLWRIVASFLLFEACVGAYFPSIGVLRCSHFPNTNLSTIMTLFQLPTNSIVAVIFFFFQSLGNTRALLLTCALLAMGAACMFILCLRELQRQKTLEVQKLRMTGKQALLVEQFQSAVHEAKLEQRGLASRRQSDSLHVRGQSGLFPRSSLGMPI